ncbi:MAG: MFS transporter, partial [Syntrophobacterales bacterium]
MENIGSIPVEISKRSRVLVLTAALLAVFLGALDALIIGAAMPTIVADLGGLELYSWVFSAYMLTRTIALPLFGKLADLYSSKKLFVLAVGAFIMGSALAGMVDSMPQLVLLRGLQGIGAGGNFALAYIVVSEISAPEERGRMMGLISFVWGVSSVLGPLLGGFIVTYLAWPWVFYIN